MGRVALKSDELAPLENQSLVQKLYPATNVGLHVSGEAASPASLRPERFLWLRKYFSVFAFRTGEEPRSWWKCVGLTA